MTFYSRSEMPPTHSDLFSHRRDEGSRPRVQQSPDMPVPSRSSTNSHRLRSEDSWIEIASQPSTSSLSSAGDNEIITTGLYIQNDSNTQRRRRSRPSKIGFEGRQMPVRRYSATGSSQDEYEESESESDRMMCSSNEDIRQEELLAPPTIKFEDEGNSTALGLGSTSTSDYNTVFTPQPNAFSHPPSSQTSRSTLGSTPTPDSYFPTPASSTSSPSTTRLPSNRTITQRNIHQARPRLPQTAQAQSTQSHSPYNILAPSHNFQPNHDDALRASLSTLLSCAAAVRGTPKRHDSTSSKSNPHRRNADTIEPTTLRLVPEAQLFNSDHEASPSVPQRRTRGPTSSPPASLIVSPPSSKQTSIAKRKARETSKDRQHAKKSRNATTKAAAATIEEMTISPTLMTWMISAGVVIVFSAISFSAGYAWGKEVGRFEGSMGVGTDGVSCGREAIKSGAGLRRLRWGTASAGVGA